MKIKVTQEDIDKGGRGTSHCMNCPVARAIQRETGFTTSVWPTVAFIYNGSGPFSLPCHVAMPSSVTEFVKAHDIQRPVEPFEFELELPA